MRQAVILDGVRTPTGKRGGWLSCYHPVELGATVLRELSNRNHLSPGQIDQVIIGCVGQVGEQGANIARNICLQAGYDAMPATTIDFQCGSSEQALHLAAALILSGEADVVVAGGVESMSRVPMGSHFLNGPGTPFTPQIMQQYDLMAQGLCAELVAERWQIGRREMDELGLRSHALAARATEAGWFSREIVPLSAVTEDGRAFAVDRDEGIRYNASLQKMSELKPAFKPDGCITAGNSSQISDGAAALLVAAADRAQTLGCAPRARIAGQCVVGVDPHLMLTGPIPATRAVLQRAGMTLPQIDLVEINEAFASVVLAWQKEMETDLSRVNTQGGAIALGHPLGASGARLLVTLLHALERTGGRYGLQAMCCGGGLGIATILERMAP